MLFFRNLDYFLSFFVYTLLQSCHVAPVIEMYVSIWKLRDRERARERDIEKKKLKIARHSLYINNLTAMKKNNCWPTFLSLYIKKKPKKKKTNVLYAFLLRLISDSDQIHTHIVLFYFYLNCSNSNFTLCLFIKRFYVIMDPTFKLLCFFFFFFFFFFNLLFSYTFSFKLLTQTSQSGRQTVMVVTYESYIWVCVCRIFEPCYPGNYSHRLDLTWHIRFRLMLAVDDGLAGWQSGWLYTFACLFCRSAWQVWLTDCQSRCCVSPSRWCWGKKFKLFFFSEYFCHFSFC